MKIEPNFDLWDQLIQNLLLLTDLVVLESQDNIGKSYLAAFPSKIFQSNSKKESEHVLTTLLDLKTWRFGFLSYELKNSFEEIHSSNPALFSCPDIWMMEPGLLIEWDHQKNTWATLIGEIPTFTTSKENDLNFNLTELQSNFSEKDYIQQIEAIQTDIKNGSYYELNLSRMISSRFEGSAFALFKAMRLAGPVPMASFISTKDWSVCCSSPELFLEKKGSLIRSNPIKGTRSRNKNKNLDEKMKESLLQSEKERAENLMIVDLVRNDFNRVAQAGSVHVTKLFQIESYKTVHQMVSEVQAELKVESSFYQVLKATFPMGSMTGAPKIEAMKAIDYYEKSKRQIYSGTIGYFSPENNATLNVVIRTAFIQNGKLFYGVGGAITSDSDPKQEWEETITKSQALLQALKN